VSGITGIDRVYRAASVLRSGEVDKALSDELEKAARKALEPFNRAVFDQIGADMPSGYAPTFAGSFRVIPRITASGGGVRIRLQGTARGRAKKRDAAALNRGVLRHKTWGQLPWHSQGITPGFWDRPAQKLVADLRDQLKEVVEKVAKKIEAQL
jgi:hypothetical protein